MGYIPTVLPVAVDQSSELPWVLWQKKVSVVELRDINQTDGRFVMTDEETSTPAAMNEIPSALPGISRQQYYSVLNRMNKASGKAGSFTAWDS